MTSLICKVQFREVEDKFSFEYLSALKPRSRAEAIRKLVMIGLLASNRSADSSQLNPIIAAKRTSMEQAPQERAGASADFPPCDANSINEALNLMANMELMTDI